MKHRFNTTDYFVVTFLAFVFISMALASFFNYFPVRIDKYKTLSIEKTCTNSVCNWMVYTDKQPLKIKDLYLIGFWESGNVANELMLRKGQYCILETRGVRFPFLSLYRNIVKVIKCGVR